MPDDATASLFGATRTRLARRHALIAPDGRMVDAVAGWHGARTTVLISPRLGAGPAPAFVQLLATLDDGGGAGAAPAGVELVGPEQVGQLLPRHGSIDGHGEALADQPGLARAPPARQDGAAVHGHPEPTHRRDAHRRRGR